MKDTLVIGGHEFQSRFILGSGKYSLDLINAAVQNAGAQIITLALRRANEGGTANIRGRNAAAEHLGCPQRGRGGSHCASVACVRLRRFRQDRNYARQQVPAAGQSGNHPRDRDPRERGLRRYAVYVPRSERCA